MSAPSRDFMSQLAWTVFGSSLGASLGVVLSDKTEWASLLVIVFVPLLSVFVVWMLWHASGYLGRRIVLIAWKAMDTDPPMGHNMRPCPVCGDIAEGMPTTRCCGFGASDAPPRGIDNQPYCPDCEELNPVYECCGKPWVKECTDKRQLPPKWPERPPLLYWLWVILCLYVQKAIRRFWSSR